MKIVCISDTHGFLPQDLPPGDVLIHAGDYSAFGTKGELAGFAWWLGVVSFDYRRVIFVPGNHDRYMEDNPNTAMDMLLPSVVVLINSDYKFEGVTFWGSPYTPPFRDWAFMKTEDELEQVYAEMPQTDILITRGPPRGILDRNVKGEHCGSLALADKVRQMKLRYHIFGHIHEGYGWTERDGTTFLNVAHNDYGQGKVNDPVVIEI